MIDERQRHIDHLRWCERAARLQAERNLPHDTDEYRAAMLERAERFRRKAEAWEVAHVPAQPNAGQGQP